MHSTFTTFIFRNHKTFFKILNLIKFEVKTKTNANRAARKLNKPFGCFQPLTPPPPSNVSTIIRARIFWQSISKFICLLKISKNEIFVSVFRISPIETKVGSFYANKRIGKYEHMNTFFLQKKEIARR